MIDIKNHLSWCIFGKDDSKLNVLQNEFLNLHLSWFKGYKKEFLNIRRETIRLKKPDGRDYEYILHCYGRRVHLDSVRIGIKNGKALAKELGRLVYGFKWFYGHIEAAHNKHITVVNYNINHMIWLPVDRPFFYDIYKAVKDGTLPAMEFDPWTGYREKVMDENVDLSPDYDRKVKWAILKQQEHQLHQAIRLLHYKEVKKGLTESEQATMDIWTAQANDLYIEIGQLEDTEVGDDD